jgi:O-acetyl-ADP-ribose deacetylase (regulator of RNase III)
LCRKKAVSYGTTAINIPAFTGNSYQYDPSKKETYIFRADDTSLSNENSTQITNVVYEPTTAQLEL